VRNGAILLGDLLPVHRSAGCSARACCACAGCATLVTKQRLANFDRWFRRRGDLVILIARFLAGCAWWRSSPPAR
jgi:hypothetical protein